ncbi:hypothetical protein ACQPZF_17565 [Actinosynnema sp. CS-041913]|uniref:hypothetical protein n=1 Tax=Actinosynnema sp. CS-041913 TaxID=3239917 RepID=UPI003D92D1E9
MEKPPPPGPPRVIICYAHDEEGKQAVPALRAALTRRAVDVVSDHDLPRLSPTSMQVWMDEEVRNRIVLCWLSPGLLRAFAGDDEEGGFPPRLGLRYEIRGILQKIYYHPRRVGCPVIPVARPGFPADQAPGALRALEIQRFDPATGEGADELVGRIAALVGSGSRGGTAAGGGSMSNGEPEPGTRSRTLRQVIHELEAVDPQSDTATDLVRECLLLADDPRCACDLPKAFPAAERVIKAVGDIPLMRAFATQCLRSLRTEPRVRADREMEARVMICAEGWYLQREYRLGEALRVTEEGVKLAEKYGDHRTAASGLMDLGRIRLVSAQDTLGLERQHHLLTGEESLLKAERLLTAIHGPRSREVGSCLSTRAHAQLARFEAFDDREARARARQLAVRAEDLLAPENGLDYYTLLILFAEIELANNRYQAGKDRINRAIEQIASPLAAQVCEVLACAYQVRSRLVLASRGIRADAARDLKRALEIFTALGQEHGIAKCRWAMIKLDPATVTTLKITNADLSDIEELTLDHRTRIRAVEEAERLNGQRFSGPARRRPDWVYLVERAAHEN